MSVGTKLVGFCNGYFGRDDYKDKVIVTEGSTWILCKYEDSEEVICLNFHDEEEKKIMIAVWSGREISTGEVSKYQDALNKITVCLEAYQNTRDGRYSDYVPSLELLQELVTLDDERVNDAKAFFGKMTQSKKEE